MRGSSESTGSAPSNFRGGKFATKKIPPPDRGIFFRDLARLAFGRKLAQALHERTGRDISTCKRWLSERHEPSNDAFTAVMEEIIRRYRRRHEFGRRPWHPSARVSRSCIASTGKGA